MRRDGPASSLSPAVGHLWLLGGQTVAGFTAACDRQLPACQLLPGAAEASEPFLPHDPRTFVFNLPRSSRVSCRATKQAGSLVRDPRLEHVVHLITVEASDDFYLGFGRVK